MKTSVLPVPDPRPLTHPRQRRGVLLLVVLSLLVMFALMGLTFVLVAGHHYRATRAAVRTDQTGDDPRALCDQVLAQIVRDTRNPNSALREHSLLNDVFGNDGVKIRRPQNGFTILQATTTGGPAPQLLDLAFFDNPNPIVNTAFTFASRVETPAGNPPPAGGRLPATPRADLPLSLEQIQAPGFFNGCVLTFLRGPAANRSTRIVGWCYGEPYEDTNGNGAYDPGEPDFNGNGSLEPNLYCLRVLAFDDIPATTLVGTNVDTDILINGRPFNGTGFGYNPGGWTASDPTLLNATQRITLDGTPTPPPPVDVPLALLPNPIFADPRAPKEAMQGTTAGVSIVGNYLQFGGLGGADEDYDVSDAQNMLLAHVPASPRVRGNLLPSLHRPDTHAYLERQGGPIPSIRNSAPGPNKDKLLRLLHRQASLRPNQFDHPRFPVIAPGSSGPWDVDNDADGITDSIWVDVGLPVQVTPDGRTYKPLAAILCLDLDGRLNVNVHGSIAHVDQDYHGATPSAAQTDFQTNVIPATAYPGGAMPNMQRGQGYGPAEINLYSLFSPTNSPAPPTVGPNSAYARLLFSRYAEPNTRLQTFVDYRKSLDYTTAPQFPPYPGITYWNDPLSLLRLNDYTYTAGGSPPVVLSSFANPHNLCGRGFPFLDVRGMPVYPYMGDVRDLVDNPYELDLSRGRVRGASTPLAPPVAVAASTPNLTPSPTDNPFSAGELERILRLYDLDASQLPDRLRALIDGTGGPPLEILRNQVTTDSFDLPTPAVLATREHRLAARLNNLPEVAHGLVDLLKLRLRAAGFSGTPAQVSREIKLLLPPEVIAGQRMDINRPFGNGRDDNGNGVVDEPAEQPEPGGYWAAGRTPLTMYDNVPGKMANGIDVNGDGLVDTTDKKLARHLYARHLYVLAMLLTDHTSGGIDFNRDGGATQEETAHGLAQWAVNVVDFRDRDSIMTPFEYDLNPFDGWNVDGIVNNWQGLTSGDDGNAQRRLVWGCERPELLITETLAFHDRRTEDLGTDTGGQPDHTVNNPANQDNDFDQRLPPRGSAFIELYNPWVTQGSTLDPNGLPTALESSGEFYGVDPNLNRAIGVRLNAVAQGTPVWRLLIVRGNAIDPTNPNAPKDPDDPILANRPTSSLPATALDEIERSVYFVNPSAITSGHGQPYFCNPQTQPAPVLPGRYVVIGSPGIRNGNDYITTIGRLAGVPNQDGYNAETLKTRQIRLTPTPNDVTINQVHLLNSNEPLDTDIQPAIATVIDQTFDAGGAQVPRPFSITEPVAGYPTAGLDTAGPEPVYDPPLDDPLDGLPAVQPDAAARAILSNNAQVGRYRVVHLQRLADPTRAYHPEGNPFLTIDTMPINLTTFNGVSGAADPNVNEPVKGIGSWQRGDTNPPGGQQIWRSENFAMPPVPADVATTLPDPHVFDHTLVHSLGHLSTAYGSKAAGTMYGAADPLAISHRSYLGAPKTPAGGIAPPWFTWHNSPFVNPLEMLLVPKSRSSKLLYDYAPSIPNLYAPLTVAVGTPGTGHLMNFFEIPPALGTPPHNPSPTLFEYLQVPSPFVGTALELNPQRLLNPLKGEKDLLSLFHPPFNRVSNYRDPGRVNINTIPSDTDATTGNTSIVWDGIINATPGLASPPLWNDVFKSRQGADTFNPATSSTRFANPFRSPAGKYLMLPGAVNMANRTEADVTLLRRFKPDTNDPSDQPLFNVAAAEVTPPAAGDPNTNAYFRLQKLQRLSNLLTTRSNVYAIWITIGYFEATAQPNGPNPVYPDGYQLGPELGSDTGEVKRHRAFYIYDRSIPVGFEPGQDHNFRDGLLLERFIE